jgi:hypothetical protein
MHQAVTIHKDAKADRSGQGKSERNAGQTQGDTRTQSTTNYHEPAALISERNIEILQERSTRWWHQEGCTDASSCSMDPLPCEICMVPEKIHEMHPHRIEWIERAE